MPFVSVRLVPSLAMPLARRGYATPPRCKLLPFP